MGPLFWSIGAFSLFAASIGIVPYTSRLAADVPKPTYRTDSSESGLYAKVVRGLVAVGMAILLAALDQPLVPLVISACLAAVTMFGLLDPAAHHEPALPVGAGARALLPRCGAGVRGGVSSASCRSCE